MAVAHEHELHYRCAFELISSERCEKSWADVIRLIRNWVSARIPQEQSQPLHGAWFFGGGDWRAPNSPRLSIKTERCLGNGRDDIPQYWAMRYEHPDSDVTTRQWRTDIGVSVTGGHRLAFSLSTIHWLLPGFLGPEPPSPLPSAPRIVSNLVTSRSWEARAGSEKLTAVPFPLRDGHADLLLQHLRDAGRPCPLVLIAKDFVSSEALIDPKKLANLLAGTAVVWESESSWVDKELEQLLGREFSCWNGMVRVYQPQVNLQSIADARRHRYFDKRDIESLGPQKTYELLVRGIVRRSRVFMPSLITDVDDVHSKNVAADLGQRFKNAERGSKEWIALLEDDNKRLAEELKQQEDLVEQYEEENASLRESTEDAEEQVARFRYELDQAATRVQEAESVRSALSAKASVLNSISDLPNSTLGVLDLVQKIYPDRICFTEKARRSANEANLKNFNIAWKCLKSMATTLHELHFEMKLPFREIAQRFRASTGFEVAIGESETTRANRRLHSKRTETYKGRLIDISPHVKYGRDPGNCLRVHYYADPTEKLIIVGHCGAHLDTVRTN